MTNDPVTHSPGDCSLALQLLSMALGGAQTAVLCTAAQLGLADHLKDGPKSGGGIGRRHRDSSPHLNPPYGRAGPPGPV